ncbi:Protein CBG24158 [Caenorhabditis briggsae]|uniref:Protein CBG24158 n=1 Tax=Caenorhabditis briggsae TaxID=6238 RepID=H8WH33_CAEBR|nr:Protein CBG24158 [Caenorhabditis briggsae]CCG58593.1 Protein CBG24158 [Caenorhabditis briggsae]
MLSLKEIAWTRVSDGAILTAGNRTFTRDPRWQVSKKSANIWVLNLRRAEHQDLGCYLCEINDKHNTAYAVYLKVLHTPVASPYSLQSVILEVCAFKDPAGLAASEKG